jgi:hypothetical protein
MESGTSVKVAVRIRPLSSEESNSDGTLCINTVPGMPQVITFAFAQNRWLEKSFLNEILLNMSDISWNGCLLHV